MISGNPSISYKLVACCWAGLKLTYDKKNIATLNSYSVKQMNKSAKSKTFYVLFKKLVVC